MSSTSVYGESVQSQLRCAVAAFTSFPVNTTATLMPLNVDTDLGPIRIRRISWAASAALSDSDGTMLCTVTAFDTSEGAADTLVNAQSVEGGTANEDADFTLAAEGTEKEFTLDAGDTLKVVLTGNSAAIDTNGAVSVFIWYHPIPKENAGDDIRHASYYR